MNGRTGWLSTAVLGMVVAAWLSAPAAADEPFPRAWYWGRDAQWNEHVKMIGEPAPRLELADWVNGELTTQQMKGKILVLDFWATWCGPCRANLPKGNDIMEKYGDRGVLMIGVCSSRGQETMAEVLEEKGVKFPVAKDPTQRSAEAWKVKWWPTYSVVDRNGMVRAVGLKPDYVDDMVEKLLEEQPGGEVAEGDAQQAAAVPAAWLEGSPDDRRRFEGLEGGDPPALTLASWTNSQPLDLASLKGKVVMLDFWATWCGPCIRSIPKTNKLMEQYGDQGLVIIGVCHSKGSEKMAEVVQAKGIRFPVAADVDGATNRAYKVRGYPDYYFIDRAGKLRVADCKNGAIEDVIRLLLAEEAPAESTVATR